MFYCDLCAEQRDWPNLSASFRSHGPCECCGRVGSCNDVPSRKLPVPSVEQANAIHERCDRVKRLKDPNRRNCYVFGLSVYEVFRTLEHADLDPREWTLTDGHGVEGVGVYLEPVND